MNEKGSGDTVQPAPAAGEGGTDSMQKIRNLLFGSQMREYARSLAELSERLRNETERLREEQSGRLGKLESFLHGELERLAGQYQQERQERLAAQAEAAERLQALGRDLVARVEALDERLSREALALRGELQRYAGEQLDALHRSHQELADTLERERARLADEKTGREELGQLFTELGLRLNRQLDLPQP